MRLVLTPHICCCRDTSLKRVNGKLTHWEWSARILSSHWLYSACILSHVILKKDNFYLCHLNNFFFFFNRQGLQQILVWGSSPLYQSLSWSPNSPKDSKPGRFVSIHQGTGQSAQAADVYETNSCGETHGRQRQIWQLSTKKVTSPIWKVWSLGTDGRVSCHKTFMLDISIM